MKHFKDNLITDSCIIDVHELFIKVNIEYSRRLEKSISNLQSKKMLKNMPKNYYDKSILYIGKGKRDRKNCHLIEGLSLLEGKMEHQDN